MVIIDIGGSFDIAEVTGFENRFRAVLKDHPANIAIHMSELSYIDSSGIGSLIRCMNYALREGTKLMCYGLNESINSVFEITHLNHFIEVLSEDDFSHKYSTIH
jgi:anti-sigma B factor antagonist